MNAGLVRDVEVHAVEAVLFHLEVDGAGHDVARGQFGAWVVLGMKRVPPADGWQLELPPSPRTASLMRKDFSHAGGTGRWGGTG
jgi:hypothetical protein